MPKPWDVLTRSLRADLRIFRLYTDRCRHPLSGADFDLTVLGVPDWVNIIALTEDQQVVLIHQYRFGVRRVTLEIPGGMVDPGEDPAQAAARELREETGYEAASWEPLGSIEPNPAIQDNRCHTFLARGCRLVHPPHFDEKEDIEVTLAPLAQIPALLRDGAISHALVAVAFQRLWLRYP